jgi:predicted unusual protein kinase regulating ubiquinone biosynthesis (AarF/ABC1/UbiB family)
MQIVAKELGLDYIDAKGGSRGAVARLFEWRNGGKPVASASIGQVYRARVRGAGGTFTSTQQQQQQQQQQVQKKQQPQAQQQEPLLQEQQPPQTQMTLQQERDLERAQARVGQVQKQAMLQLGQLEKELKPDKEAQWILDEAGALVALSQRGCGALAGCEVAVKVQRPDARGSAALDVYLLRVAGAALKKIKVGGRLWVGFVGSRKKGGKRRGETKRAKSIISSSFALIFSSPAFSLY